MSQSPPNRTSCVSAVEAAIHELSDTDWYRLRQAARISSWKVPGLEGESLLFEALERTLDGRRRWNRDAVDFIGHLLGVMRSLANHEAKRRGLDVVALTSSMDLIGGGDPESALSAEEQIGKLRAHFRGVEDTLALQVLDAMQLGCDGPAIRLQLSLDQTQLETVIRRIRRVATTVVAR